MEQQPYEFKVGSTPGKERKREFVDNPNGLFSAQAAPKPPPAMYYITEGMKVGGKVKNHAAFVFLTSYNTWLLCNVCNISSIWPFFVPAENCDCSSRSWLWSERNERDTGENLQIVYEESSVFLQKTIYKVVVLMFSGFKRKGNIGIKFVVAAWSYIWAKHRAASGDSPRREVNKILPTLIRQVWSFSSTVPSFV